MPRFFILLTKRKLNIWVFLRTSLEVMTLKTFFLNNLAIFFGLDIVYCILASLLINILNLSIKKQISDWDTKLTCSGYFLDFSWLYLTIAKDVKSVDVIDIYIESFFVKETSARFFFVVGASITSVYIGVDIKFFGTSLLLLINVLLIK